MKKINVLFFLLRSILAFNKRDIMPISIFVNTSKPILFFNAKTTKFLLLLVFILNGVQIYSQTPTLIGSQKFSAVGSGASGVPSINYNIPAGSNRVMVITCLIERYHDPDHSNMPTGTPSVQTLPSLDIAVGGINTIDLFNNTTRSPAYPNTTMSGTRQISYLSDANGLPTGNTAITFPNINLPNRSSDEMSVIITVYSNVKGIEFLGNTNEVGIATTTLATFTGTPQALPVGRVVSDILYVATGGSSQNNTISASAGWTSSANLNNEIVNSTGASTGAIYANEPDGISHMMAYRTYATAVNPTVTFSRTSTQSIHSAYANMFALIPFAKPAISGSVRIDNTGTGDGINGTAYTSGNLYVNAVDINGNVIATAVVNASGNFTFSAGGNITENNLVRFKLSRIQGTVGQPEPAQQLPTGWLTVGENSTGVSPFPADGNNNGIMSITIGASNIAGIRFGITADPCSPVQSGNIDSDGDGISDVCDLDDDNDGILDITENCSGFIAQNTNGVWSGKTSSNLTVSLPSATFQTNIHNFSDDQIKYYVNQLGADQRYYKEGDINFSYTFSNPVPANEIAFFIDDLDFFAGSSSAIFTILINGNPPNGSFSKVDYGTTPYLTFDNISGKITPSGNPNDQRLIIKGISNILVSSFSITSTGVGAFDGIAYSLFANKPCDTDGDGIVNQLDLDSDNDGCPDVIEGGANFTSGASYITNNALNTTVNSSGVPAVPSATPAITGYNQTIGQTVNQAYTVNPAAVAGTASSNQTIVSGTSPLAITLTGSTGTIQWQSSTDNVTFANISGATSDSYSPGTMTSTTYYRAVVSSLGGCSVNTNSVVITVVPNTDSDGDEVVDYYDLDDDNDGILDTDEGFCLSTPLLIENKTFSATGSGAAGRPNITFSAPTTGTGKRLMFLTLTIERDHTPTLYGDNWESTLPATNNFANAPVVKFGSNNMTAVAYNTSFKHSPSISHSDATISVTQYVYTLWDSQISAGLNSIDLSNFQLPKNAGDEWHAEVLVFDHVNNLEYIGVQASSLATNSLSISGNMLANSQPAGTIEQNNVLLAFGATSAQSGMSINSGWNTITSNSVANTNGTYATDPNTSSDLPENDGISVFTATKTGVTGNQTATFSLNKSMATVIMYRLIPFSCNLRDTDGDGIPDYLDLDSDGDGCPDAIEGDAAFTTSNLVNSSMPGGNTGTNYNGTAGSITSNLGNTVGNTPTTMGVPTIAGTGQGVGGSRIATIHNQCLDSDGDGIPDWQDLDDDNDGILDTAEICKSAISTDFFGGQSTTITTVNGANVVPTTATITPAINRYYIGWHYGDASGAINQEMSINFSNPVYFASDNVDFSLEGLDIGSSFGNFFIVYEDGVRLSNLDFSLANITGNITTSTINGAKAFNSGAGPNSTGSLTLNGIDRTKRIIKMGYTVHALNGSSVSTSENIIPRIQIDCDMDGDGIPNQLDLDSDGDGCSDAIEGAGNFTASQLTSASGTLTSQTPNQNFGTTVDANGVPTVVGASGQAIGQSQDKTKNDCIDSDGDGYPDWQDLDDDNDGILDAIESPNCFYAPSQIKGLLTSISSQFTSTENFQLLYNSYVETSALTGFNFTTAVTIGSNPAGSNLFTLEFYFPIELSSVVLTDNISSTPAARARLFGSNDNLTFVQLTSAESNINTATGTTFTINQNQGKYKYYKIQTTVAGAIGTGDYIREITPIVASNYVQSEYPKPTCVDDLDGDGTPNHLDLDSDGDSCFDAIEGDENVLTSNLDGTGRITGTVNANGVPNLVNNGGAADVGGDQGQSNGQSKIAFKNDCVDSDADGVADWVDLDDDNDGILDTDEGFCSIDMLTGNVILTAEAPTMAGSILTDNNNILDYTVSTTNAPLVYDEGASFLAYRLGTGNIDTDLGIEFDGGVTEILFRIQAQNNGEITRLIVNGQYHIFNPANIVPIATPSPTIIEDGIALNGGNGGAGVTYTYSLVVPDGIQSLVVQHVQNGANGIFARISVVGTVYINDCEEDLDGDGIPNHLDTDSDGDGCFDAIEGDENAENPQLNPTGSINSAVDSDGVPILVNTGGAADVGGDQGQGIGSSQNAAVNNCYCTNPGDFTSQGVESMTGISDLEGFANGWPKNVPNGYIVIESKNSGFVITRVNSSSDITAPVEGMLIYDITDACIKLYNGSIWQCIQRKCNN